MSNKVRAKFRCTSFKTNGENSEVHMEPVYDDSEENKKFFASTPGGDIHLYVVNPDVTFEEGKEYYVDFTLAG